MSHSGPIFNLIILLFFVFWSLGFVQDFHPSRNTWVGTPNLGERQTEDLKVLFQSTVSEVTTIFCLTPIPFCAGESKSGFHFIKKSEKPRFRLRSSSLYLFCFLVFIFLFFSGGDKGGLMASASVSFDSIGFLPFFSMVDLWRSLSVIVVEEEHLGKWGCPWLYIRVSSNKDPRDPPSEPNMICAHPKDPWFIANWGKLHLEEIRKKRNVGQGATEGTINYLRMELTGALLPSLHFPCLSLYLQLYSIYGSISLFLEHCLNQLIGASICVCGELWVVERWEGASVRGYLIPFGRKHS